jgi:chaperonin cofactor prefoldin
MAKNELIIQSKAKLSYSEIKEEIRLLTSRINTLLRVELVYSNVEPGFKVVENRIYLSIPQPAPLDEFLGLKERVVALEADVATLQATSADHESRISALESA